MPVFGKTFKGIEAIKPRVGMMIGLYPPGEGSAACHAEFQVVDGFLIQAQVFDDVFVQFNPIGVGTKRFVEIREGHLPAMPVNPGGEHGEIIQEFECKTKRDKKNPETGNQQEIFDKGIGFPNKKFHNKYKIITI
jgi:hypothetical protein